MSQDRKWGKDTKRSKIWASTGFRCVYCGVRSPIRTGDEAAVNYRTLDHIIPKACGGGRLTENLLPACYACNSARNHSWPPSERCHPDFRKMVRRMEEALTRMPLKPAAKRWLDWENRKAEARRRDSAWKALDDMRPNLPD